MLSFVRFAKKGNPWAACPVYERTLILKTGIAGGGGNFILYKELGVIIGFSLPRYMDTIYHGPGLLSFRRSNCAT
jgi:hypothetical protein